MGGKQAERLGALGFVSDGRDDLVRGRELDGGTSCLLYSNRHHDSAIATSIKNDPFSIVAALPVQ
jgi:hypothetical protein